jgi:hypothetical protein
MVWSAADITSDSPERSHRWIKLRRRQYIRTHIPPSPSKRNKYCPRSRHATLSPAQEGLASNGRSSLPGVVAVPPRRIHGQLSKGRCHLYRCCFCLVSRCASRPRGNISYDVAFSASNWLASAFKENGYRYLYAVADAIHARGKPSHLYPTYTDNSHSKTMRTSSPSSVSRAQPVHPCD